MYRYRHILSTGVIFLLVVIQGWGQNIFVLEKVRKGGIRMYYENDFIKIKTKAKEKIVEGKILLISDSSLIVNYGTEVLLSDIEAVYKERRMLRLLQSLSLLAGGLYVSISALNGLINNDNPLVPSETLKISGGLLIGGILLTPLTSRKFIVNEKRWSVKILDFTD